MSLFINGLSLAAPVFSIQVYDRVLPNAGVETLKAMVIGMLAIIAFDFVLKQARGRMVQMIALRLDVALSKALFSRLSGMPLNRLERHSDAEWRAALRDGESIRDLVAGPTLLLAVDLPFAILFVMVISMVAQPVAWVLMALIPVYLLLALASSVSVRKASQSEHQASTDKFALAGEIVSGRGTAKALGLGAALRQRWEVAQASLIRQSVFRGALVDNFNHLSASLGTGATVAMTTVGALAIIDQQMTVGGLIAANMLASRVVQPLGQLIGLWRSVERYRDASSRLDAILAEPVEGEQTEVAMPRPTGGMKLEAVRFGYDEGAAPVVDGVTAIFRPGTITGVLGANGSGKTTLLKLLQGLYAPDSGRVLLDGADIAQFGRFDLARWVGYVPQESFLFAGTVRDNIARGRTDVSDEAILSAAQQAGVSDYVAALPDGYGAEVGEGGQRFSPGVRQRIALARALLEDPPVLVLDEPSASLDFEAEAALCEELQRLKADRTVVLVSHARPVLETCDTLIVLNEGRIAMSGRGDDILPRPGSDGAAATMKAAS